MDETLGGRFLRLSLHVNSRACLHVESYEGSSPLLFCVVWRPSTLFEDSALVLPFDSDEFFYFRPSTQQRHGSEEQYTARIQIYTSCAPYPYLPIALYLSIYR